MFSSDSVLFLSSTEPQFSTCNKGQKNVCPSVCVCVCVCVCVMYSFYMVWYVCMYICMYGISMGCVVHVRGVCGMSMGISVVYMHGVYVCVVCVCVCDV